MSLRRETALPVTNQKNHDDVKKKKTDVDTSTKINNFNEDSKSFIKVIASSTKKNSYQNTINDLVTLKTPETTPLYDNTTTFGPCLTQRTLAIVTAIVRISIRTTAPFTLDLRPSTVASNLNVVQAHRNICSIIEAN